jgi:hypothetical protein
VRGEVDLLIAEEDDPMGEHRLMQLVHPPVAESAREIDVADLGSDVRRRRRDGHCIVAHWLAPALTTSAAVFPLGGRGKGQLEIYFRIRALISVKAHPLAPPRALPVAAQQRAAAVKERKLHAGQHGGSKVRTTAEY